jgi:hypothetical protein
MRVDVLTRDNPHLSRLTNGPSGDPDSVSNEGRAGPIEDQLRPALRAGICKTSALDRAPNEVAALVEASIADSTRRAYRSDLDHFSAWGGMLPAEPPLVASDLAAHAETLRACQESTALRCGVDGVIV